MNTLTEVKLDCLACRRITVHAVDNKRIMCTVCGKLHHPERSKLFEPSSLSSKHGGLKFRAAVSPYLYLTGKGGA